MKTPSYEYELLHQFEVIFRDGEHKTQAATRDYSKVWESIIDNPPAEGVTPIHVYRLNGETYAVIAGMDDLVENEECAMEIVRLAAAMQRERECRAQLVAALSRCEALVHLLTVRQVVSEGGKALEASGLNPWCLNEGLATGDELLSTWWIDAALAAAKEME